MHFWQLKTFWHETKLCSDDLEVHSYAEISTIPAIVIERTSKEVKLVVNEMLKFKAEFTELRKNLHKKNHQDLTSFWLRKTKKPVLAVLMVKKDDDDSTIRLYRGTNMEVSMPTGSLCAERNVIGSALAADLTLRRQDLKYVAVYSACLDPITPDEQTEHGASPGASPGRGSSQPITPQLGVHGSRSSSESDVGAGVGVGAYAIDRGRSATGSMCSSSLSVSTSASRSNSYSESIFADTEQGLSDSSTPVPNPNPNPNSNSGSGGLGASPTHRSPDKPSNIKMTRQTSRRISHHGMNELPTPPAPTPNALPDFDGLNKTPRSGTDTTGTGSPASAARLPRVRSMSALKGQGQGRQQSRKSVERVFYTPAAVKMRSSEAEDVSVPGMLHTSQSENLLQCEECGSGGAGTSNSNSGNTPQHTENRTFYVGLK